MRHLIATVTMLALLLGAGIPAWSQTSDRVFDTITDLLRGAAGQELRGFVVTVHDEDIVVRGKDDRTYTIATTGIDKRVLVDALKPGQPIKVKLRRGDGQKLVAASMEADTGTVRSFRTVPGTVEPLSGDRIQFRTTEGFVIPVDLGQMVGTRPPVRAGEAATLTYEMTGKNPLVAVWIEPSGAAGAASPRTVGYERVHGFIQAIGTGSFTLKTDDGRSMLVDVRNSPGGVNNLRPGDLVSVVGRTATDRFSAELVQKD